MSAENVTTRRSEPRLSTGVEALDRVIGGFPLGSVIVVAGSPGSGHEMFARQMLYNTASNGSKVTYLTVDRPPEEVVADMQSQEMDAEEFVAGQSWSFINGFEARMKVNSGELGPKVFTEMLKSVSGSAKKGDWTCVDTASKLLELTGEKEFSSFMDELTLQAREGRGVHLLVVVEELHDKRTLASLAQATDGYLKLGLDEKREEPTGVLRIEKLRHTNSSRRNLNYQIADQGIVIETATRIM